MHCSMDKEKKPRSFSKTMKLDSQHYGLIVGRKGAGIKQLKEMPGVLYIRFDKTKDPAQSFLHVKAENRWSCQAVLDEVNFRIRKKAMPVYTTVSRLYLPEGTTNGLMILKGESEANSEDIKASFRDGNKFFIAAINTATSIKSQLPGITSATDSVEDDGLKTGFRAYSAADADAVIEEALAHKSVEDKLEFSLSPGQIQFKSCQPDGNAGPLELVVHKGRVTQQELDAKQVKPFFNSFPLISMKPCLMRQLTSQGYQLTNSGTNQTASFTRLHLEEMTNSQGDKPLRMVVILAVDDGREWGHSQRRRAGQGNRDRSNNSMANSNSAASSNSAAKVLVKGAAVVGRAMVQQAAAKMTFRNLSLQSHTARAMEAFARLYDSTPRVTQEKERSTARAQHPRSLSRSASRQGRNAPKILQVKTNRRKLCTLTTVMCGGMDLRASLATYRDDPGAVSENLRGNLHDCWNRRDMEGGIGDPHPRSGIRFEIIKQVTSLLIYTKEVELQAAQVTVEVSLAEMRVKDGTEKVWHKCMEIYIKVLDEEERELSPKEFLERWELMKLCWRQITKEMDSS